MACYGMRRQDPLRAHMGSCRDNVDSARICMDCRHGALCQPLYTGTTEEGLVRPRTQTLLSPLHSAGLKDQSADSHSLALPRHSEQKRPIPLSSPPSITAAVHQSSPGHCSSPVSILSFPDCSGCPGLMKSLQGPRLGMVCPLLPLWSPLSRGLSHPYPNASNNPDTNQSSLWSQGKKYDSKFRTSH